MTPVLFSLVSHVAAAADELEPLADMEFGGKLTPFAVTILTFSTMVGIGEQFMNLRAGHKADWAKPFIRTVIFSVLLGLYSQFAGAIIGAVHMAGSIDNAFTTLTGEGEGSTTGVLAVRVKEFQKVREKIAAEMKDAGTTGSDRIIPTSEDIALLAESVMTTLIDDLLYAATWFTFTFAAFAVFAIKTLSGAVTNILLEVGPLMIAFAALPGLTSRYLTAWVMALIEVTAWGPVAGIILGLLQRVNTKSAGLAIMEDANYAEHIVLNFVYAGLFLAVPAITHMILSGSASAVGSTGMAAAMGGMAAAGRMGKSAVSTGAAVAGEGAAAASKAVVGAANSASGRVGDAMSGNATAGTVQSAGQHIQSSMVRNDVADARAAGQEARDDRRDHFAAQGAINKRKGD